LGCLLDFVYLYSGWSWVGGVCCCDFGGHVYHLTWEWGSFLGARFFGVVVDVLLKLCDSSDNDEGDDTASDVCIRFFVISDRKSRNDLRELGLIFENVT